MSAQLSESQTNAAAGQQKPPAFMSHFFKAPVFFYRLGLGWMFRKRLMVPKHIGRKTGKVHKSGIPGTGPHAEGLAFLPKDS